MTPTAADVLAVVSAEPCKVGDLGRRLLEARGVDLRGTADQPVGQVLAAHGLSLSAVQQVLDGLVREGRVAELRGRALWDQRWPGLGPDAKGRHFLLPPH